jgi:hypothetical protein
LREHRLLRSGVESSIRASVLRRSYPCICVQNYLRLIGLLALGNSSEIEVLALGHRDALRGILRLRHLLISVNLL